MTISETEFKGKAILVFRRDEKDKFPISFGVRKCKVILENLDAIQAFYHKHMAELKPSGATE